MATILLLDDDKHFRALVVTTLKARGHDVIEAARCREADAVLDRRTVDLILVDGLLPDGDGAAWIIKFRTQNAVTPILFVSAFWKKDVSLRTLPVSGILHKPLAPEALASKVERLLRTEDAEPEISAAGLAQLELMRASYRRDLPGLLRGLRDAINQLRRAPENPALRGVARRRAHQIAGTAGSFGFDPVGDACAKIEEAILSLGKDAAAAWASIDESPLLQEDASFSQSA